MDLIDLIKRQGEEINNLYDILDGVIKMFDDIQQENKILTNTLIHNNNNNINRINKRLNYMDINIEFNNTEQTHKKELLTRHIKIQLTDERKKNGLYKTDITKRVSRLKRENKEEVNTKIKLLQVDINKNDKNVEFISDILRNQNEIKLIQNNQINYRKKMDKIIQSLKNEIRIRTRNKNEKINSINGINII